MAPNRHHTWPGTRDGTVFRKPGGAKSGPLLDNEFINFPIRRGDIELRQVGEFGDLLAIVATYLALLERGFRFPQGEQDELAPPAIEQRKEAFKAGLLPGRGHDRLPNDVDGLIHCLDPLADLPLKRRNADVHELAPFLNRLSGLLFVRTATVAALYKYICRMQTFSTLLSR